MADRIPHLMGLIISPYQYAAPAGSGSHRYWRILINANDGSASYDAFSEIEWRATVGGADQTIAALFAPASASSTINSSNAPWNGCDDDIYSGWLSASASQPQWWEFDFNSYGGTVTVGEVVITSDYRVPTAAPKDFDIQYSDDDSAWTTALTVIGETGWSYLVPRAFVVP